MEHLDPLVRSAWELATQEAVFAHYLDGGYSPDITQNAHTIAEDLKSKHCLNGQFSRCNSPLTCLHSLGPPIRVPLTPPPLRSRLALTFTIEQPPPFPIDSLRVPYLNTVPYQSRLSDVILRSCSV